MTTAAELTALHERLTHRAAEEGLLDVAYRTLDSPVGTLLVAATERGVVRVAFDVENHDTVLQTLATRSSPRVLRAPARRDPVVRGLDAFFAGTSRVVDVDLDLRLAAGFRRDVLTHLQRIPYGETRSYAAVAAETASPKAVRAVGSACARNPLPLVIPCHRVVRSDGTPGRYAGGEAAKQLLLELETQNY